MEAQLILTLATALCGQNALSYDGDESRTRMGPAPGLNAAAFTLECWFRRLGSGDAVSTGSGGLTGDDEAVPLVTKGRSEANGDARDLNYFLGLHDESGVLVADLEEHVSGPEPGLNHPVFGSTPVADDAWHHAAVTYDGTCWQLYLDGVPDTAGDCCPGVPPNFQSIQHFAVGTAVRSDGSANGHFEGEIDEVRVWDRALTAAEIAAGLNLQIESAPGLIGRWGFDEGAGQTAHASAGLHDGQLGDEPTEDDADPSWAAGAPFDLSLPPEPPALLAPQDGADGVELTATLRVAVSASEPGPLEVTFHAAASAEPFTIIALPDTQKYVCSCNGGSPDMFEAQTQWIVDSMDERNTVFVTQLGDCVQHGDDGQEWTFADTAMSVLEDPLTTMLFDGLPYGIAVGNHDQEPAGDPDGGSTTLYNEFFGVARFLGRQYYGGHHGVNNDNHFQLFSASGHDFIAIHLEYDEDANPAVLAWADALLETHADRRAIVIGHYLLTGGGDHSDQGQATYDALKHRPNLFLMLCGHVSGEERRTDEYDGRTVHTLLSDYQSRDHGGDGWLRILEFSPVDDEIRVMTYSPILDEFETDGDSQFTLAYEMDGTPSTPLGTVSLDGGGEAALDWAGLMPSTTYAWFVTVEHAGGGAVTGPPWSFTTACRAAAVPGDITGDAVVDVSDLVAVIGEWGGCPGSCPVECCPADLNGDCIVGVADLAAVLAGWP